MKRVIASIRKFARQSGLEIHGYNSHNSHHAAVKAMLRSLGVDLVLDVGANVGQFALDILSMGYHGRIVSFEPVSAAYASLTRNAAAYRNWELHPRCAIGDRRDE